MASELKVDKFTGVTTAGSIDVTGEGNSTTTNLQQGLAKHWVKFGPSASATASFNNSSITDNGVGIFRIARTNSFSSANYITQVNGEWTQGTDSGLTIHSVTNNPAISSSEVTLVFYNSSFAQYDTDGMMASMNGDLA